jgi:hypothetical protein
VEVVDNPNPPQVLFQIGSAMLAQAKGKGLDAYGNPVVRQIVAPFGFFIAG